MPGGAWFCPSCGEMHGSQHTLVDSFCPACGESREAQQMVTCSACAGPLCITEDGWDHFPISLMHRPIPVPRVGMRTAEPPDGTVCSVRTNGCKVLLPDGRRVGFMLDDDGEYRPSTTWRGGGKFLTIDHRNLHRERENR